MDEERTLDHTQETAEPTYEQLLELKQKLTDEYNKIQEAKAEQQRIYDKFIEEKTAFNEDMKTLNAKVLSERKRLKDESMFFEKKMQILQNGFMQLDLDRKQLEREKREWEHNRTSYSSSYDYGYSVVDTSVFFSGVNNPLALRKRYKDLLKIFHPDNMCGDERIVKAINEEYERLKKEEIS